MNKDEEYWTEKQGQLLDIQHQYKCHPLRGFLWIAFIFQLIFLLESLNGFRSDTR